MPAPVPPVAAAIVVFGVPAALVGYILLTERIIQSLPEKRQGRIRPWLWIAPAAGFLIVFLVYPTINTFVLSFQDRFSREFIGFENYAWFFGDSGTLESLRNSVLWVVFMTGGVVLLGLLIAVLLDRVRYEPIAKTVIFIPLAISFVAAAIIWRASSSTETSPTTVSTSVPPRRNFSDSSRNGSR